MQLHKDNDEKELKIDDDDELQLQPIKMDELKENVNDQVMFD
jgi:hypothetical protein